MASPLNRLLAALRGRLAPASAEAPAADDGADEPEDAIPATREEEIRGALKWFNRFEGPPAELVAWFPAHETSETNQETHAYDLRGASLGFAVRREIVELECARTFRERRIRSL